MGGPEEEYEKQEGRRRRRQRCPDEGCFQETNQNWTLRSWKALIIHCISRRFGTERRKIEHITHTVHGWWVSRKWHPSHLFSHSNHLFFRGVMKKTKDFTGFSSGFPFTWGRDRQILSIEGCRIEAKLCSTFAMGWMDKERVAFDEDSVPRKYHGALCALEWVSKHPGIFLNINEHLTNFPFAIYFQEIRVQLDTLYSTPITPMMCLFTWTRWCNVGSIEDRRGEIYKPTWDG